MTKVPQKKEHKNFVKILAKNCILSKGTQYKIERQKLQKTFHLFIILHTLELKNFIRMTIFVEEIERKNS